MNIESLISESLKDKPLFALIKRVHFSIFDEPKLASGGVSSDVSVNVWSPVYFSIWENVAGIIHLEINEY
jgi:hypothetical protein